MYKTGEYMIYTDKSIYKCIQNTNFSPTDYPQAWEKQFEKGEPQEPVEPELPVEDEYPEYVQPTGAHDAYNEGDKITFEGEKYTCKMNGCVWSPKDYPDGWEKVVKQSTLEEPPITENVQI